MCKTSRSDFRLQHITVVYPVPSSKSPVTSQPQSLMLPYMIPCIWHPFPQLLIHVESQSEQPHRAHSQQHNSILQLITDGVCARTQGGPAGSSDTVLKNPENPTHHSLHSNRYTHTHKHKHKLSSFLPSVSLSL